MESPKLSSLIGKERENAILLLVETVEHGTPEQAYSASTILAEEASKQRRKYEIAESIWRQKNMEAAISMITEYRESLKKKIVVKHLAAMRTGQTTKEMQADFLMLDNLEKNACFTINEGHVYHRDCKICQRNCSSRIKPERPEAVIIHPQLGDAASAAEDVDIEYIIEKEEKEEQIEQEETLETICDAVGREG